jgi:hypothetical protein
MSRSSFNGVVTLYIHDMAPPLSPNQGNAHHSPSPPFYRAFPPGEVGAAPVVVCGDV